MNHTITVGGLLLTLGMLAGFLGMAFGLLNAFANGMADTQGDGGKQGCIIFCVSLAITVGSLVGLAA